MTYLTLLDGTSAAIVLGGTAAGTLLRCGWSNTIAAASSLAGAMRSDFDAAHAQSELALQVQQIHRDGLLRAEPRHFGDRSRVAVATFIQAADLAPVFGLAGTLIALSQMPTNPGPGVLLSHSIPMAIVCTFYGLVTAHLLFAPLARFIERHAAREEAERQKLVDWLAAEVAKETGLEAARHAGREPPPPPSRKAAAA
ncbi:MAG: hypothetical protein B7Z33_10530 [Sphingomonadales bacterium 12-68-11]|nr:MAG: hypothetical protein B7Z33_10530 [Sphingomonadales bacterium 12-68-11]